MDPTTLPPSLAVATPPPAPAPVPSQQRSPLRTSTMTADARPVDCSVRVAVRLRPLIAEERYQHCEECIRHVGNAEQVVVGKHSFTFDHVHAPAVGQDTIYEVLALPLLDQFLGGFHATILAYGQTGSGKTYTMGSQSSLNLAPGERGIIPRFIADLVERLQAEGAEHGGTHNLRVQFLEVYGEDVNDLLNPLGSRVTIREVDGQVVAQGACEVPFATAEEALELLEQGTLHRSTGATNMNARSSRSHAIFTIALERSEDLPAATGDTPPKPALPVTSKFHFVDLAGSERAKRTGATGKRLREGIDINRGLLTLGNVISALGDDKKRGRVHVPYRDSKLTRMLQDALGGNSKTVMICCVSPSDSNLSESLNALRYANRARNIQNRPVVNRDAKHAMLLAMREMLAKLAAEVLCWRRGQGAVEGGEPVEIHVLEELAAQGWSPRRAASAPAEGKAQPLRRALSTSTDSDRSSFGGPVRRESLRESVHTPLSATRGSEADLQLQRMARDTEDLARRLTFLSAERDFYREKWALASPEEARALLALEGGNGGTTSDAADCPELLQEKSERVSALQELHSRVLELEGELRRARAPVGLRGPQFAERGATDEAIRKAREALKREEKVLETLAKDGEDENASAGEAGPDAAEAEEFEKDQMRMGLAIQELATSIDVKEEMLVHLESQREKFAYMKTFYEARLAAASAEIDTILGDREKLLEELQQLQARAPEATGAMEGEKEALLEKLDKKDRELSKLRKTQRQLQEHARIRQRSERQIEQLEKELGSQKQRRAELIRRMNLDRKKQATLIAARAKEISTLKKQVSRAEQASNRLKTEGDQKQRIEKKHVEEISTLRKKVMELRSLQTRSRSFVLRPEDRQMRRWLQGKMRVVAEKEERVLRLEKEYEERVRMLEKRELLEGQKADLFHRRRSLSPPPPPRDAPDPRPQAQALDLDILAVEEQLEDCNAALEYKQAKIVDLEGQVGSEAPPTPAALESMLEGASPTTSDGICRNILASCHSADDAGSYIRILFGMLRTASVGLRKMRMDNLGLTRHLDEVEAQMELYRRGAEEEKQGYERRLLELRREQDAKFGGLLEHSGLMAAFRNESKEASDPSELAAADAELERMDVEIESDADEPMLPPQDRKHRVIVEVLRHRQEQFARRATEAESACEALQQSHAVTLASLQDAERRLASQEETLAWKDLELRKVQAKYRELRDRASVGAAGGGSLLHRLVQAGEVSPSDVTHDEDLADDAYESTAEAEELQPTEPHFLQQSRHSLRGRGKAAKAHRPRQKSLGSGMRFDLVERTAAQIAAAQPGTLPEAPVFDRLTNPQFYTGIFKPQSRSGGVAMDEDEHGDRGSPEVFDGPSAAGGVPMHFDGPGGSGRESHGDAGHHPAGGPGANRITTSQAARIRVALGSGATSMFASLTPRSGLSRPRSPGGSAQRLALGRSRAEGSPGRNAEVAAAWGTMDTSGLRSLTEYRNENVFSRLSSARNYTGIHRTRPAGAGGSPSPPALDLSGSGGL